MSIVTSIGHRLGKRIAPLPTTEISEKKGIQIDQVRLLLVKNSTLSATQLSQNLLFGLPQIPSAPAVFNLELPLNTALDFGFEQTYSDNILSSTAAESILISENLFQPLFPQIVTGKNYSRKSKLSQEGLFPSPKREVRFAKAYKREKTPGSLSSYKTESLNIWDLIYPSLLPPLDNKFDEQFELFKPLFGFQPAGIEFLVTNESALLADEMGTGKTVMTSVALKLLFRLGKAHKVLVICPLSLLRTWQDHLRDWANELELTVVRGTPETRKLDWKYPAHVYIATYGTIASDFLSKVKKNHSFTCPQCDERLNLGDQIVIEDDEIPSFICPYCRFALNDFLLTNLPQKSSLVDPEFSKSFDVVILDEAQYIKNSGSQQSRAVRIFNPSFRWALTGTPIENRLDDLVSIFKFVRPALFKNEHYLSPSRAVELIEPHFLRRMKKDVMKDLPPKVKQEMWLELNSDQRKAYDEVNRSGLTEIENMESVTKIHIFALLTKLKQICNFATGTNSSAKTEELIDLIEQIKANQQKVLVFSQYDVEGVTKLEPLLRPYGVVVVKGSMSAEARNLAIDRFRNDPNICVFLASIKTGGVGLTLTEASYVIHFDHWWNPAVMWQADDRVHRSGQTASQVNIYSFWMQNTVEERIYAILKEKRLLFDEVINGLSVEEVETMISTDEWLEILGVKSKRKN